MTAGARVFLTGKYTVSVRHLGGGAAVPSPPKPLLVASPTDEGEFPLLLFLHGYLLYNSFYTQLISHVASHGFIVVAPQLYTLSGPDTSDEIENAALTVEWLAVSLPSILPPRVAVDFAKLGVAGHSRGGKVAFGLVLGLVKKPKLKFSAVIGIDPVDGMDKANQTPPLVLTYVPRSLQTNAAAMVIGSGLGEQRKGVFPPCAPAGVNHKDFAAECPPPSIYLVAGEFGHFDMLDDVTPGLRGKATYCLCKSGGKREPLRRFVAGAVVAFLKAFLLGDDADLLALKGDPSLSPVLLSTAEFCLE
ncbi:chlorophyllase-2-like isoform X1 [Wolffia australiana]